MGARREGADTNMSKEQITALVKGSYLLAEGRMARQRKPISLDAFMQAFEDLYEIIYPTPRGWDSVKTKTGE